MSIRMSLCQFNSRTATRSGPTLTFAPWRASTKPAFWLGAYSKFLFAVFVAYHTAILVVAIRLTENLPFLWDKARQPGLDGLLWSVCFVGALAGILRLTIELWHGIAGLVTARLDVATEALSGVECTPEMAPQLHKLISEVGSQVKSPLPNAVRISPRAECYVCELRHFSISTQRELMLVLGLPHLAVLNTSELKVIVAHELAHFRRGDTRLGVFLHRFLESLRDANERQRRTRWIDPVYWIRSAFFRMALLLVAPVWKHQELRADVASANAYGGRLTARTLLREWLLGQQFEATVEDYVTLSSNKRLQETLAQFNIYREFAVRFQGFSPEAEEFVRQRLAMEEESSLFDSHPTMHSRVDAVLVYPDREMPNLRPASHLLSNFSDLEERLQQELFSLSATGHEKEPLDEKQKLRHLPTRHCA
jgi:Zn-dependent protease with chaperone function